MKKPAIAIATIALIGTPAFAADMAVKAPPPAPAPVYNWTGWYAGVNAGASFGDVKTDFNSEPITASVPNAIGGGSFVFSPIPGLCWLRHSVSERFHRWWSNRPQLASLSDFGRGP
jgi:opacity protein-like surface antigen